MCVCNIYIIILSCEVTAQQMFSCLLRTPIDEISCIIKVTTVGECTKLGNIRTNGMSREAGD